MSTTFGKASWPVPALTDAPNITTAVQAIATQIDPFVVPKYASSALQAAANPTPADGDQWYRTDTSTGYKYRAPFSRALIDGDSFGLIQSTTLASPAASFSIPSISQGWQHLLVIIRGRSSASGSTGDNVNLQWNGLTGAHYSWVVMDVDIASGGAATSAPGGTFNVSQGVCGAFPTSGFAATGIGQCQLWFQNYTDSTQSKQYTFQMGWGDGGTNVHGGSGYGTFGGTGYASPISSLLFYLNSGSNFTANTSFFLYGFGS